MKEMMKRTEPFQVSDEIHVHFMFTKADAALLLLFASSFLQFDDSFNTLNSFGMEMETRTSVETKTL